MILIITIIIMSSNLNRSIHHKTLINYSKSHYSSPIVKNLKQIIVIQYFFREKGECSGCCIIKIIKSFHSKLYAKTKAFIYFNTEGKK